MKQYNLVICDDEFIICKGISNLIAQYLPEIAVLDTYPDALDFLESGLVSKTDIVISDIRMKNVDGLTLVTRLKELNPECLVIFLTGYENFEYAHFAVNNRVVSYLTKPVDPSEVIRSVRFCIRTIQERSVSSPAHHRSTYRSALQMIHDGYSGNLPGLPLTEEYRALLQNPYLVAELAVVSGRENPPDIQTMITVCETTEPEFICCCTRADADSIVLFFALEDDGEDARAAVKAYLDTVLDTLRKDFYLECTVRLEPVEDIVHRFCFPASRFFREYRVLISDRDSAGAYALLKNAKEKLRSADLAELAGLIYARYFKGQNLPEAEALMGQISQTSDPELISEATVRLGSLLQTVPSRKGLAVDQILEYMEENYHKPLSLKLVGDHFVISTEHICRLFRTKANSSFKQQLAAIRIRHAKEFLLSGKYNISETARLVGFDNPGTFSATFKRHTGLTPHAFALKYLGANALDENDS